MNKIQTWRICRNMALAGSLSMVIVPARLVADTFSDASPQCKMQLVTSTSIMLGEPITIRSEMVNPSEDRKLWVRTGLYQTDWYTLDMVDQSGHPVVSVADTRTREPKGAHGGDLTIVQTSSSVPIDIVVTRFLSIARPGKYTLTVHVRAPYTQTEALSEDLSQAKNQIESDGSVLTKDFTFPLTITPASPLALQGRANALKQDILKGSASKSYYADFDALFAMPEAIAWKAWADLANQGNSQTQEMVATKLEGLNSIRASDLLMQMLDGSTQSLPGLPSVSDRLLNDCLHRMYNDGSADLRGHIKSLYAQRGIQLPDKADVPQVID